MNWSKLVVSTVTIGVIGYGLFIAFKTDSTMTIPTAFMGPVTRSDQRITHEEEVGESTIFRKVANVHREASLRAQAVAPLPVGNQSPIAPGSTQKGEKKRAGIMEALTRRAMAEIAAEHSMTVEKVEQIYRRGEAEGWPR